MVQVNKLQQARSNLWNGCGLPYEVVLTWLQASYRGTKFCFCLYFFFKLDYSVIIDAYCRKHPRRMLFLNPLSTQLRLNSHVDMDIYGT